MTSVEIKSVYRMLTRIIKAYKINRNPQYEEKREQSQIIKAMHGIEKGLSLRDARKGFGIPKVLALISRIDRYSKKGYDCLHPSIQMALGAIEKYIEWNKERDSLDEKIEEAYNTLLLSVPLSNIGGGTIFLTKKEVLDFDAKEIDKCFMTRHSLRDFSGEEVDIEKVKEAIKQANRCPSACNRQPTKVHIICSEEGKRFVASQLEGTGGFADKCSAFLLITGELTAFDFIDSEQLVVNAGIYAGYLVLALHSKGIASCVIQRSLLRTKKINYLRSKLNIPDNEEIVCAIGIGCYPEEFNVPHSVRLPLSDIITIH